MYYYLPERIYNAIIEIPEIKRYLEEIEGQFAAITCFRKYMEQSSEQYSTLLPYRDQLENYIRDYLANKDMKLYEQFKINNGEYNVEEMLKMFNDDSNKNIDVENMFFLLSNIINQTYADHTFEPYIHQYTALYESLTEEQKTSLSKYIHLKYMYARIYQYSTSVYHTIDWQNTVDMDFTSLYSTTLSYTNDKDVTANCLFEALATSLFVIDNTSNQFTRAEMLELGRLFDYRLKVMNFQYKDVSLGVIRFMDMLNMLYLGASRYADFYNQTAIICNYISNSFKDESRLLRGLKVYDKVNMSMYGAMVRKYVRLIKEVPMLSDISITNISDDDMEYIMGDVIGTIPIKEPNQIAIQHTIAAVDKWFDRDDNGILDTVKQVQIEGM